MALGRDMPDDLIADVLRCLPPRSLAVSRCVCSSWRDVVDTRRLLRADLLPRSVGGIFIKHYYLNSTEFLARPTMGPSIGDFEFIPGSSAEVMDHCNGLVLCRTKPTRYDDYVDYDDYVANPATRQWARLPLPPEPDSEMSKNWLSEVKCLVYDPTVSPHYDVFLIHSLYKDRYKSVSSSDPLQVYVYSSKTDRWEERSFALDGRLVENAIFEPSKVYWRGAIYIPCKNGFVLRISISNSKYTLIPTPPDVGGNGVFSLGKSEKGVYCAFEYGRHGFRIFLLKESCGQIVWELRHSVGMRIFDYGDQPNGPWILRDINHYRYPYGNDKHKDVVEGNFEWNSDDDIILNTEEMVDGYYAGYTSLLGFHPYKEIVFLNHDIAYQWRAVAYHWNTSKFQDLGNICPKDHDAGPMAEIETSFIYTPCWVEDFPKKSLSVPIED